MPTNNIAIYAPYTLSDTSLAAVALADLAVSRGLDCRILAANYPLKKGLHSYWDKVVRSQKDDLAIKAWADSADMCVWFSLDPYVERRAGNAKHVVVYSPTQQIEEFRVRVSRGYSLIFPKLGDSEKGYLCSKFGDKATRLRWPSYLDFCTDAATVKKENTLMVFFDKGVGCFPVFKALVGLLSRRPGLNLTLVFVAGLSKAYKKAVKALVRAYQGRVKIVRCSNLTTLERLFCQHKFCWYTARKTVFGSFVTLATACNCCCLVYDIYCLRANKDKTKSGVISCGKVSTGEGIEVAIPDYDTLDAEIDRLLELPIREKIIVSCRNDFQSYWEKQWA